MDRRTLLKRFAVAAVAPAAYSGYAAAAGLRGSSEWLYQALRGGIPGVTRVVISGSNSDIDTATVPEDIWGGGGLMPRATSAETWEIVSTSANDTAGGTGAQSVSLETLGTGGVIQPISVVPNGLTAVTLTGTHLAANAGAVTANGSLGHNDGDLTIRVAGGGATRAVISATNAVLNQSRYTVPTGYRLDMLSMLVAMRSTLGSESALMYFMTRTAAGRELATVPFPLFASGVPLYRHEVSGGLAPFVSLGAGTEANARVFSVTQNNMTLDVASLALRIDTTIFPT